MESHRRRPMTAVISSATAERHAARLLDVRSSEEFGSGHLSGAVNIPVQDLDRHLADVGPPDGDIVVYCRSGHRSSRATALLRAHGFTKVHDLGPMTAW
jgi:phage shock protein E